MKENLKKQTLIFFLLLSMAAIVFTTVYVLVTQIHWTFKLIAVLSSIVITFYIFVNIKKLNKQLVYIEKEKFKEETNVKNTPNHKVLCPKCYHPYDGQICFVCGYNKNENKA